MSTVQERSCLFPAVDSFLSFDFCTKRLDADRADTPFGLSTVTKGSTRRRNDSELLLREGRIWRKTYPCTVGRTSLSWIPLVEVSCRPKGELNVNRTVRHRGRRTARCSRLSPRVVQSAFAFRQLLGGIRVSQPDGGNLLALCPRSRDGRTALHLDDSDRRRPHDARCPGLWRASQRVSALRSALSIRKVQRRGSLRLVRRMDLRICSLGYGGISRLRCSWLRRGTFQRLV